jgi:predicted ABC-type ATPase
VKPSALSTVVKHGQPLMECSLRNVYIVAGPNGVGKTTFAREFLPHYANCRNFVNADLIAQGIAPLAPELAEIRAGRLMLNEIDRFLYRGEDFGFETTLSGRTLLALIRRVKSLGYQVHFFYLWVFDVELLLSRIQGRVLLGGHNVPANVVRRRFARSIRNFLQTYSLLADSWYLFDNFGPVPVTIAQGAGTELRILRRELYSRVISEFGGAH